MYESKYIENFFFVALVRTILSTIQNETACDISRRTVSIKNNPNKTKKPIHIRIHFETKNISECILFVSGNVPTKYVLLN